MAEQPIHLVPKNHPARSETMPQLPSPNDFAKNITQEALDSLQMKFFAKKDEIPATHRGLFEELDRELNSTILNFREPIRLRSSQMTNEKMIENTTKIQVLYTQLVEKMAEHSIAEHTFREGWITEKKADLNNDFPQTKKDDELSFSLSGGAQNLKGEIDKLYSDIEEIHKNYETKKVSAAVFRDNIKSLRSKLAALYNLGKSAYEETRDPNSQPTVDPKPIEAVVDTNQAEVTPSRLSDDSKSESNPILINQQILDAAPTIEPIGSEEVIITTPPIAQHTEDGLEPTPTTTDTPTPITLPPEYFSDIPLELVPLRPEPQIVENPSATPPPITEDRPEATPPKETTQLEEVVVAAPLPTTTPSEENPESAPKPEETQFLAETKEVLQQAQTETLSLQISKSATQSGEKNELIVLSGQELRTSTDYFDVSKDEMLSKRVDSADLKNNQKHKLLTFNLASPTMDGGNPKDMVAHSRIVTGVTITSSDGTILDSFNPKDSIKGSIDPEALQNPKPDPNSRVPRPFPDLYNNSSLTVSMAPETNPETPSRIVGLKMPTYVSNVETEGPRTYMGSNTIDLYENIGGENSENQSEFTYPINRPPALFVVVQPGDKITVSMTNNNNSNSNFSLTVNDDGSYTPTYTANQNQN